MSRIYVCGPYKMNEEMSRIFKRSKVEKDLIQFM